MGEALCVKLKLPHQWRALGTLIRDIKQICEAELAREWGKWSSIM